MYNIELYNERHNYKAGESIEGTVEWRRDEEVESIEVRLFWFTKGKGTQDVGMVDKISFDNCGFNGRREFSFEAPTGPYSFSGRLISLVWGIEMVVQPGGECERVEIVVSGTGEEVILGQS